MTSVAPHTTKLSDGSLAHAFLDRPRGTLITDVVTLQVIDSGWEVQTGSWGDYYVMRLHDGKRWVLGFLCKALFTTGIVRGLVDGAVVRVSRCWVTNYKWGRLCLFIAEMIIAHVEPLLTPLETIYPLSELTGENTQYPFEPPLRLPRVPFIYGTRAVYAPSHKMSCRLKNNHAGCDMGNVSKCQRQQGQLIVIETKYSEIWGFNDLEFQGAFGDGSGGKNVCSTIPKASTAPLQIPAQETVGSPTRYTTTESLAVASCSQSGRGEPIRVRSVQGAQRSQSVRNSGNSQLPSIPGTHTKSKGDHKERNQNKPPIQGVHSADDVEFQQLNCKKGHKYHKERTNTHKITKAQGPEVKGNIVHSLQPPPVPNDKDKGNYWYGHAPPPPPVPYFHPAHAYFVNNPDPRQQVSMTPICLTPMMMPYAEGLPHYNAFHHHIGMPHMARAIYNDPNLHHGFGMGNGQWYASSGNRTRKHHSHINNIKRAGSKRRG